MREHFPRKAGGDRLSAPHVNKLSQAARRSESINTGSHMAGINSTRYVGSVAQPPHIQKTVEIVGEKEDEDGIYNIKLRYRKNNGDWETDEDGPTYELDSNSLEWKFDPEEVVIAWFDHDAGYWIPLEANGSPGEESETACLPLVDYGAQTQEIKHDVIDDSCNIHFALEESQNGVSNWKTINSRVYTVSPCRTGEQCNSASGVGLYTFYRTEPLSFVRLVCLSEIGRESSQWTNEQVKLNFAVIRLRAVCPMGIPHTTQGNMDGGVINHLYTEASVSNTSLALGDNPFFELQSDGKTIAVYMPPTPTANPYWTIAAEVAVDFLICNESSLSSISRSFSSSSSAFQSSSSAFQSSSSSPLKSSSSSASIVSSSSSGGVSSSSSDSGLPTTTCCYEGPASTNFVFANSDCGDFPDAAHIATWNTSTNVYEASITCGAGEGSIDFELSCSGTTWTLDIVGGTGASASAAGTISWTSSEYTCTPRADMSSDVKTWAGTDSCGCATHGADISFSV